MVDAHFAIAMRRVSKIVAQGVDVTTPTSLALALQAEGGMANSVPELVDLNRIHPNSKSWDELRKNDQAGLQWVGRNNEYCYGEWSTNRTKVEVSIFQYSGVGEPTLFQFSRKGAMKRS